MTAVPPASEDFFAKWLDIAPGPRPPDHYTLLGLRFGEADEETIKEAAKARTQRVRSLCLKFPEAGTEILNLIAKARLCLLDPVARHEYDNFIANGMSPPTPPSARAPAEVGAFQFREEQAPLATVPVAMQEQPVILSPPPSQSLTPAGKKLAEKSSAASSAPIWWIGTATAAVIVIGAAGILFFNRESTSEPEPQTIETTLAQVQAPALHEDATPSIPAPTKNTAAQARDTEPPVTNSPAETSPKPTNPATGFNKPPTPAMPTPAPPPTTKPTPPPSKPQPRTSAARPIGLIHNWVVLNTKNSRITGVKFCPDSRRPAVVTTHTDRSMRLWDYTTGRQLSQFAGHRDVVTCAAFTSDGEHILSGSRNGTLLFWDVNGRGTPRTLTGHVGQINCVAVSPDGKVGISGGSDRTLQVWNLVTEKREKRLTGHGDIVTAVAFSADGQRAVSAGNDCTIRSWEIESGRELARLVGHTKQIDSVAIATDGKIVSSGFDLSLRIWDAAAQTEIRRIDRPNATRLILSADGRLLVSGANSVQVWNVEQDRELYRITLSDRLTSAAFSPDQRQLVVSTQDQHVSVFQLPALDVAVSEFASTPASAAAVSPKPGAIPKTLTKGKSKAATPAAATAPISPRATQKSSEVKLDLARKLEQEGRVAKLKGNLKEGTDLIGKAKLRYEEIIKDFPDTKAAQNARQYLEKMNP